MIESISLALGHGGARAMRFLTELHLARAAPRCSGYQRALTPKSPWHLSSSPRTTSALAACWNSFHRRHPARALAGRPNVCADRAILPRSRLHTAQRAAQRCLTWAPQASRANQARHSRALRRTWPVSREYYWNCARLHRLVEAMPALGPGDVPISDLRAADHERVARCPARKYCASMLPTQGNLGEALASALLAGPSARLRREGKQPGLAWTQRRSFTCIYALNTCYLAPHTHKANVQSKNQQGSNWPVQTLRLTIISGRQVPLTRSG